MRAIVCFCTALILSGCGGSSGIPELNQGIYECYNSRTMRMGPDREPYFEKPSRISILSVERREKVERNDGTPYYVKTWIRFKDGTTREDDSWVFFVNADKSVTYTTWGSLAWSNFLLDSAEAPPRKPRAAPRP